MCECVRVERSKVNLGMNLVYGYCRRGEKVKEESDGNFIRKGGSREKDGDNGVWVLTRDGDPNFG